MIDLTPLDVRNKRGDFKRLMRGYDPQEVDIFLELVAERLEALVRENLQLKERTGTLQQQVTSQLGREQAVQDALVTAQELRADIKAQSQREAETILREAETEARRLIAEAEAQVRGKLRGVERRVDGANDVLTELERRRARFLKEFRQLLEREIDVVEVEEGRTPLEERTIDLDLGPTPGGWAAAVARAAPDPVDEPSTEPSTEPTTEPSTEPSTEPFAEPSTVGSADEAAVDAQAPVAEAAEPISTPRAQPATGAGGGAAVADRSVERDVHHEGGDVAEEATSAPHAQPEARAVPGKLETPSFSRGGERRRSVMGSGDVDELSASMEAEAVAEAGAQVVEITGADGDGLADVPRLEQVLAEAGADLVEARPEPVSSAPQSAEEIAPPRITRKADEPLLLYLDPDDADA